MSVWVELRCEESCEEYAQELYTGEKINGVSCTSQCYSHHNDGCGEMSASASQKSVIENYKDICDHALKAGWKRINGNWVCPHCAKYRKATGYKTVKRVYAG